MTTRWPAFILVLLTVVLFDTATAHADCTTPAGVAGQVKFDKDLKVMKFCDDTNWRQIGPRSRSPQGCPDIADRCDDDTIYVGTIDYGFGPEKIYLYDQDYSGRWKNSYGEIDIVPNSTRDGRANVANLKDDISNYPAFSRCYNLEASGYDDWYSPASDELILLGKNYSAINAISENSLRTDYYWASTEASADGGTLHKLNSGTNTSVRHLTQDSHRGLDVTDSWHETR